MISPALRGAILLSALLLSSASLAFAQESQAQIKKVPIKKTSVTSGAEMFSEYCAACHGPSGKGDGPAASALRIPPANLTTLAQRHGGKFPDSYVATVLDNGVHEAKAHGSKDMPVWGALFGSISGGQSLASQEVKLRISNMSEYLRTLQSM
jgi:mono/diheme cytochrome c family protein